MNIERGWCCNLDSIARMALQGWPVIPAVPGEKQTYYKWGEVKRDNYNFGRLFKGAPIESNCAILCEDTVAVVDYDNHGPEPNGASLFRRLEQDQADLFRGAIIELTQSGGYHCYYQGIQGSTYKAPVTLDDGMPVDVEVLCGRRLCYCWPSIVTNKGRYVVLSHRNFLNTRPEELPRLPEIYKRPPEPEKPARQQPPVRTNSYNDTLTREDLDAAISYYTTEAHFNGAGRHDRARALARCLAGLDLSETDIIRHVEAYIRRQGRELSDKKEAERIAAYGMKHPLDGKPWKAITKSRRNAAIGSMRKVFGGRA